MVSPGRLSLNWSNPGSEMGAVLPGFVTCFVGVSTGDQMDFQVRSELLTPFARRVVFLTGSIEKMLEHLSRKSATMVPSRSLHASALDVRGRGLAIY